MKKVVLLVLVFSTLALSGWAQNYKLRTVVVYSFTKYILWPEGYTTGDFEIKVLGESPFVNELKVMAQSKKVGDRPIKVTKINDLSEIKRCHVLIVPASRSSEISAILQSTEGQPVLVVTEEPGMGSKGSDINFVDKDGKLAFELNQNSINKRKLKVSTELTRLAILI
ncbi:MAG TPA: YfiR family protein [Cyclobacteriaceae bacterium]|nr:YfiR family protein [Cyclobacteriaceae bacterium]